LIVLCGTEEAGEIGADLAFICKLGTFIAGHIAGEMVVSDITGVAHGTGATGGTAIGAVGANSVTWALGIG
jgi:hypothetical protein